MSKNPKLRDLISFQGLRDDVNAMSRNLQKQNTDKTNPIGVAKTCVFATAVALPACVLSFINKEFAMGFVFVFFALVSFVMATLLYAKAKNNGYLIEELSKDGKNGNINAVQEPEQRISTRERMRMRKLEGEGDKSNKVDAETDNDNVESI